MGEDVGGDLEVLVGVEPEECLGGGRLLCSQCSSVCLRGVAGVGGGPSHGAAHRDEGGPLLLVHSGVECLSKGQDVDVAVGGHADVVDIPSVGLVPRDDVLGECHLGVALDGDVIVVPDDGEVGESLRAC